MKPTIEEAAQEALELIHQFVANYGIGEHDQDAANISDWDYIELYWQNNWLKVIYDDEHNSAFLKRNGFTKKYWQEIGNE